MPCSYSIQARHNSTIIKLKERKPHYQIVAYNDTDVYKFKIHNENAENITIILNSITGDADMQVKGLNNSIQMGSYNDGYSPDVITITRDDNPEKTLVGEYNISVRGATFSSYSILYYTYESGRATNPDNSSEIKPITSDIIELETGKIIKDFVIEYKNTTNYKVYSYNPKILETQDGMDIRITLTPEHSEYKIYVLFDILNVQFNSSDFYEPITNYIWKSNYNNEIIIKKNDEQYKKNQIYYIFVVPIYTNNNFEALWFNTTGKNSTGFYLNSLYYLGVTNEVYPFLLQESYPSSISLDSNYISQIFWYYHYNISNPVSISLNVYYGRVDIYVDFKWQQDLSNSATAIKVLDTTSTFFTIPPAKLKENSQGYPSVPIYILVKKSSALDSQFLLSVKSSADKPELLIPGNIRQDSLLVAENKYFFFYLRKGSSAVVNVGFKYGYGDLYFNIFKFNNFTDTGTSNFKYPNRTNYMYKSQDSYMGESFAITQEMLKDCESTCKVLIALEGSYLGSNDDKIEYSLSYYQNALTINQNQPYRNQVNRSEMKFFRVYFPKNTKNIYISLTNMPGDADLYVNYGEDLPSLENFVWSSATPNSEFVDFNLNDNFFAANKKTDISGNYTIMVYGFSATTFTLYITSHPKKIISLEENSPASCSTTKENDSCYFRFDNLQDFYSGDIVYGVDENSVSSPNANDDLKLIVNTDFIYGKGFIYVKLYNNTDYDILQDFPDEKNYDYSNINSNIRNFLRMNIKANDPKINSKSSILITVKCIDKCFFDLMATKQYRSSFLYLDYSRENIFYVSNAENKKNLFIYYNNKQGDIDVFVRALEGKANVKIYTNTTISSQAATQISYKVNELENFISEYPQKEVIHKPIASSNLTLYDNLYFEVNPFNDYTFIIRLTYQHQWTKINLGKSNVFKINPEKKRFYGYFHMHDVYDNVLLTISVNQRNLTAYAYVKYVLYEKSDKNKDTSNSYSNINPNNNNMVNIDNKEFDVVPSENDNDYRGNNLNLMKLIAFRLPKIPKEKLTEKKLVKVLFTVHIFDFNNLSSEAASSANYDNIELQIMASPEIKNVIQSVIPQKTLYYSLLDNIDKNNSTLHIYDLKRQNATHNTLYVEISSCKGVVDILISKNVINSIEDAQNNLLSPVSIQNSNGRAVYKFANIDSEHFYMMLKGKQVIDYECLPNEQNIIKKSCGEDGKTNSSNVLVYYYTTKSEDEKIQVMVPQNSIVYEVMDSRSIKIKWTPLIEVNEESLNNQEKVKYTPADYEIYISNSLMDYVYMDSVCYLNNMKVSNLKNEIYSNNSEAKIFGLRPNEKYFINILAKKKDFSDVVAYKSIEVILERTGPSRFTMSK